MGRKLAIWLVVLSLLVPSVVNAVPASKDTSWQIISKLNSLNSTNSYKGQYGLYYNLYYLTLYARWTDLIHDRAGTHALGFSGDEVNSYRRDFLKRVESFNVSFGGISNPQNLDGFNSLQLTYNEDIGLLSNTLDEIIQLDIPNYISERLDEILEGERLAKEESEYAANVYFSSKKQDLRYIYKILQALTEEQSSLRRMVTYDTILSVSESPNAWSIVSDERYNDLLERGRAFDIEENMAIDNAVFPDTGEFVHRLSFASKKTKDQLRATDLGPDLWYPIHGNVTNDVEFKLRENYAMIMASSSVYRPFVSYAGDIEFREALRYLAGIEGDRLLSLYEQVKDFRKPLYYVLDETSLMGSAKPDEGSTTAFRSDVNKAQLIYLDRFIEFTEKGTMFGLLTLKGSLQKVADDANSYGYFNNNELMMDETSNSLIAVASEEQTSNKWARSVYQSGKYGGSKVSWFGVRYILDAGTNLMIMNNIIKDLKGRSKLKSKKELLYLNAFGDIVTRDNLIIVPGSTNPMMYHISSLGYNPYTVAFMSGYPSAYEAGNRVQAENDVGKYLSLQGGTWGDTSAAMKLTSESNISVSDFTRGWKLNLGFTKQLTGAIAGFYTSDLDAFSTNFLNKARTFLSDMLSTNNASMFSGNIVLKSDILVGQVNLSSYDPVQDLDYSVAKFLAENMYMYYKTVNGQPTDKLGDVLDQDFIFRNVLVEGLDGTIYATGYHKLITESVENIIQDSYTGFKNITVGWNRETIDNFGDADGVLGIKSSHQNAVFGEIIHMSNNYFWIIVLLICMLFIVRFMRDHAKLSYTLVMLVLTFAGCFLYMRVVPLYAPQLYNIFVNDTSEVMAYKILGIKTERYEDIYGDSTELTPDGKFSIDTASINLYRFDENGLNKVMEQFGIKRDQIVKGNIYIVDKDNGIYLEGNNLKMSVDVLFANNPITGGYEQTDTGVLYQVKGEKVFSSMLDYYIPYYQIQDGFIDTLNRLLMYYTIPRHTVTYLQGFSKDSYVVHSYINSPPFLTPGKYNDDTALTTVEELEKLSFLFDNPELDRHSQDFLNLHALFKNPSNVMKETLWWRTMEQEGYFTRDITTGDLPEKYYDLIESVNMQTKRFLLDLSPDVGHFSDENLIKMISLYATITFNLKVSNYWNWLYPVAINYQDFTLNDVLLVEFQDDRANFIMSDADPVAYVADNEGSFTLMLLAIDTVLVFLLAKSMQLLLPALYLLYGFLLIGRIFFGASTKPLTAGFIKITGIYMVCLTLFVCSFGWVMNLSPTVTTVTLLIIHLIIIFVILSILSALLFNFTELGNSAINEQFKKLGSKLGLKNLTVENANIQSKNKTTLDVKLSPYHNNYSMDSRQYIVDSTRPARAARSTANDNKVVSTRYYSIKEDIEEAKDKVKVDYGTID